MRLRLNKKHFSSFLIIIIYFLNIFSFLSGELTNLYSLWTLWGNLSLLILIFLFQGSINKSDQKFIFFLFIFFFFLVTTTFITDRGLNNTILLSFSLFSFFVLSRENISLNTMRFIYIIALVFSIYWLFESNGYYNNYTSKDINPNRIGYVIMILSIYMNLTANLITKKTKLLRIIMTILGASIILNVRSRGAFIGFIVFIILDYLIPKKIWRYRVFIFALFVMVIISGYAFPYLYVYFYDYLKDYTIPFFNKSLYTGREIIWINFFDLVKDNSYRIFFGIKGDIKITNGYSSLHNSYLKLLANFGIIGVFSYFSFFIIKINSLFKKFNYFQIRFVIGFLSVLILGLLEINLFSFRLIFLNILFISLAFNKEIIDLSH